MSRANQVGGRKRKITERYQLAIGSQFWGQESTGSKPTEAWFFPTEPKRRFVAHVVLVQPANRRKVLVEAQRNTVVFLSSTRYYRNAVRRETAQLFKELNWLLFPKRVQYHTCLTVYKSITGQAPEYISSMLTYLSERHERQTRSTVLDLLHIPPALTAFSVQGPQ